MSKRSEKMKSKTFSELKKIAESGSLSSAAAEYELKRREKKGEAIEQDTSSNT